MQSVEVRGEGLARRSAMYGKDDFLTHVYEDAKTFYQLFLRGLRMSEDGECLGSRNPPQPYKWITYSEVKRRAENLGSAFLYNGHSKTTDSRIGIFSQNRVEWTICELACYTYSLVAVPLYDTLGTEAICYILDKASISTVLCDVADKVNLILDCIDVSRHTVKTIVVIELPIPSLVTRGRHAGIDIVSLQDMEKLGQDNHRNPVPPQPDDVAIICFTSGTTGYPKGAILTHKNIVSNCSAFIKLTEHSAPFGPSDIHLSYLPLAHMFERVVQGSMLMHGGRIGYFTGNILTLLDDAGVLKPTVFPVIPRLLNKIYDRIFGQANTGIKRWFLELAYRRKNVEIAQGIMRRNTIWDRLVFGKVQASLGGCVRLMLTGAAPVSSVVLSFLRAAMGCQFYEGYGQTEATAGCTVTMPGDWTPGHVGAPLPCNWIKLVDVPEMNYLASRGEGEVCVKGANVFQGYLDDPVKTAETLDEDGWLHTGDIGKWLPNGTLKLVDRKKHIFKLAQGEYIAPEKIENVYIRSSAIAQCFVYGESLQAFLVAVVVPDPEFLVGWVGRTLGVQGTYEELCARADVKKAILEDMIRLGKEGGLKSFEQVKAIHLHTQLFTIQNGLLTPTLKAKRHELRQFFQAQIDKLYSQVGNK